MDFEPLIGVDLVGTQDLANVVIEDLGGRSGQRLEAGLLETSEVRDQVLLGAARAFKDFECAKGMDVDSRRTGADRGDDVDVIVAVEFRVYAAWRQTSVAPFASASRTRSLIWSNVNK